MARTDDRVNCYLPASMKRRFREQFGADASFSEVLREGVAAKLAQARESDGTRSSQVV